MRHALGLVALLYLAGYEVIRFTNAEVWEKDYETYVIFPENPIALYYAYRPLTYLDGALTGMRFHIGLYAEPGEVVSSETAVPKSVRKRFAINNPSETG